MSAARLAGRVALGAAAVGIVAHAGATLVKSATEQRAAKKPEAKKEQ